MSASSAEIVLPYRFDTTSIWHTILKGALALNALLLFALVFSSFARPWPVVVGLSIIELTVLGFTRVFLKCQED